MLIVCDWCKKDMGEKEPLNDKSVTGSICPDCADTMMGRVKIGMEITESGHVFLDRREDIELFSPDELDTKPFNQVIKEFKTKAEARNGERQ